MTSSASMYLQYFLKKVIATSSLNKYTIKTAWLPSNKHSVLQVFLNQRKNTCYNG